MTKRHLLACAALWLAASPRPAVAFNQPPVNLGLTSFLDGGPVPPGIYLIEYFQQFTGLKALDRDGNAIPGGARVSALAVLNQVFALTPMRIYGAHLGFDVILPLAAPTATGSLGPTALSTNRTGLGDLVVGPALQWNKSQLFGRPFFHRIEVGTTLPTGSYDRNFAVNPGSNLLTIEPYYSFTSLFADNWETSWRILYAVHGENDATRIRPGQLFHFNCAISRAIHPKLRLGAAGYFLQQTTDDRVNGASTPGTRERALALGPGLAYATSAFALTLSHPIEFGVRNRIRGSRTSLQLILKL